MIEIKRWDNSKVIHSGDFESVKQCLEDGVRKDIDFSYAMLDHASLVGARLDNANLVRASLVGTYLDGASLVGANIDYSSWPLLCGSLEVNVDDRIARQLAYHTLSVMTPEMMKEFLSDPIKYANGFHRVDECGEIKGDRQ